ncbi:MAG: hypothetical protein QG624_1028, partial [Pseudomonadota bacterium]|nr:hypothetical protein [Pseudomonadota bacterium]
AITSTAANGDGLPAIGTIIHQGATGNRSTTGQLRASIKFALITITT